MEYMQLSMDDYIQSKNEIKQELGGIVKSFVRIGWQLTRIDKSGAYKHDGYNTIAEFARTEYGMNPSGVSRFMKVYEKYSVPGDTPELKEQYREFKFNNLVEMLQLPEEDQQIFHPEDKREDIRELKDFNKENESNPMNLLDWKSAQSTEDKLHATIQEFFREKTGILNALYSSEAYQSGNIKEMAQIVNPGDSMSYRKGTVFLMFHAETISGALKKSKIQHDVITYRNLDIPLYDEFEVNDLVTEGQFISTSVTQGAALNKSYKILIYVPKGSKGAYIERISRYPKQRELPAVRPAKPYQRLTVFITLSRADTPRETDTCIRTGHFLMYLCSRMDVMAISTVFMLT